MDTKDQARFRIKAIETHYKGYKFRSRLEARYAVFFDTLGIRYYYEHEGFSLEGVAYLPDFYLPQYDCYIEIKGQEPTEEELDKARLLATYGGKAVFLFAGNIDFPGSENGCQIYSFYPPTLWKYLKEDGLGHDSTQKVQLAPELLGLLQRAEFLLLTLEIDEEDGVEELVFRPMDISWKMNELQTYTSMVQQQLRFLKMAQNMIGEHEEEILAALHDEEGWEHELLGGSEEINYVFWRECVSCGKLLFHFHHECPNGGRGEAVDNSPRLIAAYTAARQARFS